MSDSTEWYERLLASMDNSKTTPESNFECSYCDDDHPMAACPKFDAEYQNMVHQVVEYVNNSD